MATQTSTPKNRLIVAGLAFVGMAVLALLALQYGPSATLDLLWSGFLGVLYVIVPVAVVAVMLLVFFRFNAWRQ